MGGKFHLKLNIGTRPIANKYCEGKMKSTLKRELKVREIVMKEAIEVSSALLLISGVAWIACFRERKPRGCVLKGGAVYAGAKRVSRGSGGGRGV